MRVLSLLVLLSAGAVAAQPGSVSASQVSELTHLFELAHERGLFNGTVVLAQNGHVLYEKAIGYADGSRTSSLTPQDRFDVGSIAKEFDAVGLMLLVERGDVRLDDRIAQFLPDLPQWARDVRVRNLLTYTDGIPPADWRTIRSDGDLYHSLMAVDSLLFAPGTNYRYSNVSVFLRRRVSEAVTGLAFREFVHATMLIPCEMTQAVLDPSGETPRHARSFDSDFAEDPFGPAPYSGWVHTTSEDLARWAECLHRETVISAHSLAQLAESFEGHDGSLGDLELANGQVVRHTHHGSSYNFEALLHADRTSGVTIALLTNQKAFKLRELAIAASSILDGRAYTIPGRSVYLTLRSRMLEGEPDEGIAFYQRLRETERSEYDFENEEDDLNQTGYYLLREDRLDAATAVFRLNADLFPQSANVHDSLGEALLAGGDTPGAIASYRRALQLDPASSSAHAALDRLGVK